MDKINCRIGRLLSIREQIQPASQLVNNQLTDARFVDAEAQQDLIGTNVPMDELLKFLLPGEGESMLQLKVLSIVGFGGIGKTALAFEVYRRLQEKFQCHAFVKVSKWPDLKRILGDILGKLTRQNHPADMDKIQLIHQIGQYLKGRRYLVVIDDLWDKQLWETIKGALPDGNYGSRVMATTRLNDIAEICCSGQHDLIYKVKPLTYLDSRRLFLKGILGHEDSCSDASTEVSDEILKMCGGMPLALKCIGSLLPNKLVTVESQKMVMNSLLSESDKSLDLKKLTKTLFLSCSGPPYTLETCALYLSTFPENNKIERDSLIRKWIADGIISKERELSLEEVANMYFGELINRNVIQQVDNSFGETYEIHSMMLYILRQISQERNFATFLSEFGIWRPCEKPIRRLSFQRSDIGISICQGNVQIQHISDPGHPIKTSKTLLLARSITIHGHAKPVSLKLLEHLHVLDLEGCRDLGNSDVDDICRMILMQYLSLKKTQITELPPQIENLKYLKTLAVTQTEIAVLPHQIGKLQNLETLDVRQTQITELPKELAQLPKLVCLLFGQSGVHGGVKLPVGGSSPWKSLKVLGAIDSRHCLPNVKEELSGLTELRELAVVCYDGPKDKERNNDILNSIFKFSNLQSLTVNGDFILGDDLPELTNPPQLRKLKVAGRCLNVPGWFDQLSNITLLDIRVCRVEENDLGILGNMSSLQRLVLTHVHLPIKQLVINGGARFASLKAFTFDSRLPWVIFKDGAMPRLENLELKLYAGPAGKIPSGILCLPRLMKVILQYSSHYASSVGVTETIAVMREEGGKHANLIVLSVNGKQENVPHNIVDSKISGGEIEE